MRESLQLAMLSITSRLGFADGCNRAESNTILLTQEFLSEMLGVRRTSVTDVASKMQAVGAISYSRGVIKVIDLGKLRNMSCECYETLRENTG
jgi:hypothetical protein